MIFLLPAILWALACSAWASDPPGQNLLNFSPAQTDRLELGQVVVREETDGHGLKRVAAAVLIQAPPEQIWNVMVDCDRALEFAPGLKGCKVLERHEDSDIIEHHVKFSWLIPEVRYVFLARYDRFKRIDFHRVSGDLRALAGAWVLEPVNSHRTLVLYSVYIDPGFFVPQWMVRLVLKRDLPELLLALRRRVGDMPRGKAEGRPMNGFLAQVEGSHDLRHYAHFE